MSKARPDDIRFSLIKLKRFMYVPRILVLGIFFFPLLFSLTNKLEDAKYPYLKEKLGLVNNYLSERFQPVQIIIVTLFFVFMSANFNSFMGLRPPDVPLHRYEKHSRNTIRLLFALDAAIFQTDNIRFFLFRDFMALGYFLYYIIFFQQAYLVVHQFRLYCDVDLIRTSFMKSNRWYIKFFVNLAMESCKIQGKDLIVADVPCKLYFEGTERELQKARVVVLHLPGGAFVTLPPSNHEPYVVPLAKRTKLPILSVDYRKAPEHKYPVAVDECFEVYKALVDTNCQCMGVFHKKKTTRIVLMGDSAGGSLACTTVIRALQAGVPVPGGVHLIYPVLELTMSYWSKTADRMDRSIDTLASSTPRRRSSVQCVFDEDKTKLQLSSTCRYMNDPFIPVEFINVVSAAYLRAEDDPVTDILISPLKAPNEIVKQFPPTFIHCGKCDPLRDHALRFAQRLTNLGVEVKFQAFPGLGHAYFYLPTAFYPSNKDILSLSAQWLCELSYQARKRRKSKIVATRAAGESEI